MRMILVLLICLLSVVTAFAQPDTLWTKTFGGSEDDKGRSVQQTSDGGYIIAGETCSFGVGNSDVWLIKIDASGTEQWSQTFGGSNYDGGWSVQQTSDGGYIITGGTESFGAGNEDVYLIKIDATGSQLWSQTFGGSDGDWGCDVEQTSDGGYIIVGYTWSLSAGISSIYLIKTDEEGIEEWSQTLGGSDWDVGKSVKQTSDGGYIIAGFTDSYGAGSSDAYLIKTDASGNQQWSQTFGGSDTDCGESVHPTSDGGYIVAGFTYSFGAGYTDVYLIKTDASGIEQWNQTFGGAGYDYGFSVQQTSDGGYIIAGYTFSYGAGESDIWLIKTDASGNQQWSQTFGGNDYDLGYSVEQTSDGGYIITGYTISFGAGYSDIYLIRLDSETGVIEMDLPQPLDYSLLPAYPNPFNPSTLIRFQMPVAGDIQIQVFDLQGNVVATLTDGWQTPGSYQVPFNASNLSSGIYLVRLTAGDFTQTQKLALVK